MSDTFGVLDAGEGLNIAEQLLSSGKAYKTFEAICEAQGGMREPPISLYQYVITSTTAGKVTSFDNRVLSRMAKLAGAPRAHAAGIDLHVKLGDTIEGSDLHTEKSLY